MSETVEIAQAKSIRLKILSLVGYDTAAASSAITFVADDPFKAELFEQQYNRFILDYGEVIARTLKAIQESKEALTLFDTPMS
ncbi:Protein of uncharacterised function (DUF2560) [Serratia liquefaciens]|uniref:DUF2560 family protein n=1 Tax=Serratia liquefaciens TaxID=614 RepID=UPI00217A81AC|nr:DUF2560 family protein [Serratia liquefaciens]CAI0792215.1 Protein of uncharacterised function (DUF2560) [Serratia liquefaciens]CAI1608149.1 Protein of uncharacterised function (DUF2560) [Serratia liquefaciens]